MRLKCIGGDNHGTYQSVPSEFRHGDMVRTYVFPETSTFDMKAPELISATHYHFYIVEILKYVDDNKQKHEFKFLRHQDVSLMEALRIALVY